MPEKKLETVQEHAETLRTKLVAEGKLPADLAAGAIPPAFSKGTVELDAAGKPIAPQDAPAAFDAGSVAIPTSDQGAAAGAPAPTAAPAAPATQTAGQESGAAAAEAAAQAVADRFTEYEEFEIDDLDLQQKVPIRVPKQFATAVKRGYPRHADYSRLSNRYRQANPVLVDLIESGRMGPLLPLIQRALSDQAFGDYVFQGYQRAEKGLPLIEQARVEAAAAGAAPSSAPADLPPELAADPFLGEMVKPLWARVQAAEGRIQTWEQQQAEQAKQTEQARQHQQAEAAHRTQQMGAALEDLKTIYPDRYTGNFAVDQPLWKRTCDFAREAGYIDQYGLRAAIVFAAQQVYGMDQERLATTSSPTAESLRALDARQLELARTQAAGASRAVGAGAPAHAAPAPPPAKPSGKNPDGSLKPSAQIVAELADWIAAGGRA